MKKIFTLPLFISLLLISPAAHAIPGKLVASGISLCAIGYCLIPQFTDVQLSHEEVIHAISAKENSLTLRGGVKEAINTSKSVVPFAMDKVSEPFELEIHIDSQTWTGSFSKNGRELYSFELPKQMSNVNLDINRVVAITNEIISDVSAFTFENSTDSESSQLIGQNRKGWTWDNWVAFVAGISPWGVLIYKNNREIAADLEKKNIQPSYSTKKSKKKNY